MIIQTLIPLPNSFLQHPFNETSVKIYQMPPSYYNFKGYYFQSRPKMDEQTIKRNISGEAELPLHIKLSRMEKKQDKMFENISLLISQSIQAIQKAEGELTEENADQKEVMDKLHESMMAIKPLKNLKEEYNQFYKKLSGVGKGIEEACMEQESEFEAPKIFDQYDFLTIEESLVDYYLRKKQYEAAEALSPGNVKRKLFEECQTLKDDILNKRFERPSKWAQASLISRKERMVSYQIKKMKTIEMVRQNLGTEALEYCKGHLTMYTDIKEEQIRRLITFILTQSENMWGGAQNEIKMLFQQRYKDFIEVNLAELSKKFEQAYFRIHNLEHQNSIAKCFFIGSQYANKFLEQVHFLPPTTETPKVLPFSIPISSQYKYHSQFYCPVSKEIYHSNQKIILLKCGHMISGLAHSKIVEGRARKRIKCPVCQEDQNIDNCLEVEF